MIPFGEPSRLPGSEQTCDASHVTNTSCADDEHGSLGNTNRSPHMAASAEYIPALSRIERLESLFKKVRSMAAAALANTNTFHAPVVAVSTVNVAALVGAPVVDGVATVAGDRVLLANQTVPSQNGIWITQAAGVAWRRPSDWASGSTRVVGETITVADGG